MELKKAVSELLCGEDPSIVRLVVCAAFYISEDANPEAAQKRVLRYIQCGDCTGFHSLFLHKDKNSRVTKMKMETQIVAVIDAWDAMTSKRAYKQELSGQEAMQELMDYVGSYYDLEVIRGIRYITDK